MKELQGDYVIQTRFQYEQFGMISTLFMVTVYVFVRIMHRVCGSEGKASEWGILLSTLIVHGTQFALIILTFYVSLFKIRGHKGNALLCLLSVGAIPLIYYIYLAIHSSLQHGC